MLIAIVMVIGLVPSFAIAANAADVASGTAGDISWKLTDDGTLTFSGTGAIPGYTLTARPDWYAFEAQIKKVVIESGITKVGNNAFNGCSVLSEVILPDTLTDIRNNVFCDCTNLSYVEYWGTTAPTLGMGVFNGCDNLLVVNVPTNYEGDAFTRGLNISKTLVASAATTTGTTGDCTWTFDDATGTLTISGNGAMAASYTGGSQPWYDHKDGITTVIIEKGVTSISEYAFYNFSALETVKIAGSVTSIGQNAFSQCTSLSSVEYYGTTEISTDNAFVAARLFVINVPTTYESDYFCGKIASKTLVPDEADDEGCSHETFADGVCTACGYECSHENYVNGLCDDCGYDLYADVVIWSDTNNNGVIDEGESTYTTINAALTSGGSYKLYRDYDAKKEGNIKIRNNVETTLDLNGKALSWTNSDRLSLNNATLTICDSSTEQNGSISSNLYVIDCDTDNARLYITGGSFNALGISSSGVPAVSITNGIAEISGGSFNGKNYGILVTDSGKVTISGGTFNGKNHGILVSDSGEVTISGGTGLYFSAKCSFQHYSDQSDVSCFFNQR